MNGIAYQNKDIASKITAESMLGKTLEAFGFPNLKVVKLLPTNLPAIESNELQLDNLFQLEDGSIAIIDYESAFTKKNFIKYLSYAARVLKRYASEGKLDMVEKLKILVIYTADVEWAQEVYDLGDLILQVEAAYLVNMDSEKIYCMLEEKIYAGKILTENELSQLMLLPLTVKGKAKKQVYIEKTVELARNITDHGQAVQALAGILTFTDKVIDPDYAARIKEEMHMTKVGQLIFNDGWEAGLMKGKSEGRSEGRIEGRIEGRPEGELLKIIELVRKKQRKGKKLAVIAEEVETSEAEVRPILECVKKYPDAEKEELLGYLKEKMKSC